MDEVLIFNDEIYGRVVADIFEYCKVHFITSGFEKAGINSFLCKAFKESNHGKYNQTSLIFL